MKTVPLDFDPDDYLFCNPDVKKSGIDPVVHWLTVGKLEARPWGRHTVRVFNSSGYDGAKTRAVNASLTLTEASEVDSRSGLFGYPDNETAPTPSPNRFADAHVFPNHTGVQNFVVYENDGTPVMDSQMFPGMKTEKNLFLVKQMSRGVFRLKGRFLFAGNMSRHFGHFFLETIPRLSALNTLKPNIDGIILSSRPNYRISRDGIHREILNLLSVDVPIYLITNNLIVEEIIVPRPEIGMNEMAVSTPRFRNFLRREFGKLHSEKYEKVYVSRRCLLHPEGVKSLTKDPGLFVNTGGVLDEATIEKNLEREGYYILHPELYSFSYCVSVYSGAKKLLIMEGGAVLPAVFAAAADAKMGVILRGGERATSITFPALLHGFLGSRGVCIDVLHRIYKLKRRRSEATPRNFVELHHKRLARELYSAGFIESRENWNEASGQRVAEEKIEIEQHFQRPLVEVSRREVMNYDGRVIEIRY